MYFKVEMLSRRAASISLHADESSGLNGLAVDRLVVRTQMSIERRRAVRMLDIHPPAPAFAWEALVVFCEVRVGVGMGYAACSSENERS